MGVTCAICSEYLVSTKESYHTPCRHVFHYECLTRWLERSNTCPQCRERTTLGNIKKIYFNFSNSGTDTTSLEGQVQSMTLEIYQKTETIKSLRECTKEMQEKITFATEQVKHMEGEIDRKNSITTAFKEQIQYYKNLYEVAAKENRRIPLLEGKIRELKDIQTLIDANSEEIEEMLQRIRKKENPFALVTYGVVVKKELQHNFSKMRMLRNKVDDLRRKLIQATMQCNSLVEEQTKRKELEDQLMNHENEKVLLQAKILNKEREKNCLKFELGGIEDMAFKCVCDAIPKEKIEALLKYLDLYKGNSFNEDEESSLVENICTTNLDQTSRIEEINSPTVINIASTENTPQHMHSQGFFSMANRNIKKTSKHTTKVPSLLVKKSKYRQPNQAVSNGMTFDGFGGHAKHDIFPSRPLHPLNAQKTREVKGMKRPRIDKK